MGGSTFSQVAEGKSAKEAFGIAVERARYDYGHAGYTGTLAEKHDFVMLSPTQDKLAAIKEMPHPYYEYDADDPLWEKVDDKWGPAGCIALGDGKFLFFGWASS